MNETENEEALARLRQAGCTSEEIARFCQLRARVCGTAKALASESAATNRCPLVGARGKASPGGNAARSLVVKGDRREVEAGHADEASAKRDL
jgi:hypothetical protein